MLRGKKRAGKNFCPALAKQVCGAFPLNPFLFARPASPAGGPNFGGYRGLAPYTLNPLKIIFKIGSRFVV